MLSTDTPLSLLDNGSVLKVQRLYELVLMERMAVFTALDSGKKYTPHAPLDPDGEAASTRAVTYADSVILRDRPFLCPFATTAHVTLSSLLSLMGWTSLEAGDVQAFMHMALSGVDGMEAALKSLGFGETVLDPSDRRPGDICVVTHVGPDGDTIDPYCGIVPTDHFALALEGADELIRKYPTLTLFGPIYRGKGVGCDYWGLSTPREVDGVVYGRRFKFIRVI